MRFDINGCSETFIEQITSFYHAFGFFVLSNAVTEEQRKEFIQLGDRISRDRSAVSITDLPTGSNAFFGHTIEDYPELKELLVPTVLDAILKKALGDSYLYLGSDLSVFNSSKVQPWHRDWITDLPVIKVGYYSLPQANFGGQLRIIPGTHHIRSALNKIISRALAWPEKPSQRGGLNESNSFPKNIIYSQPLPVNDRNYIYNHFGQKISAGESALAYLPHQELEPDDTAFICFDPRAVHAGTWSDPIEHRIMFSALFAANPFADFPHKADLQANNSSDLALQLLELLVVDRLFHDVMSTYHPTGKLPDFASDHLIDFGHVNDNFFVNYKDQTLYFDHLPRSGLNAIEELAPDEKQEARRRLNASYYT